MGIAIGHATLWPMSTDYEPRWPNGAHVALSLGLSLLSLLALVCSWHWSVSVVAIAGSFVYLQLLIFSAALRFGGEAAQRWTRPWLSENKQKRIEPLLGLPDLIPSMFIIIFVLFTFVCGFAQLYIASKGVFHECTRLSGRFDAFYFSVITITTVGYGDFVPVTLLARLAAITEILSGSVLLLTAFPILASRLANFDK